MHYTIYGPHQCSSPDASNPRWCTIYNFLHKSISMVTDSWVPHYGRGVTSTDRHTQTKNQRPMDERVPCLLPHSKRQPIKKEKDARAQSHTRISNSKARSFLALSYCV
ncbi:hypothetical protein ACE6H2_014134 [Prunus campanulata]